MSDIVILELEKFLLQAAKPEIGIYAAEIKETGDGFHMEIQLDGLEDPTGKVDIDECTEFSRNLSDLIDKSLAEETLPDSLPEGLTEENYTLEVGSTGAERVLRLPQDLERFRDEPLQIKFEAGEVRHNILGVFVESSGTVWGEEKYIFERYTTRRKRNRAKWESLEGDIFSTGNLVLSLSNIIEIKLYLDF